MRQWKVNKGDMSLDGEGCNVSKNLDTKDLMEFSLVQYHSTPMGNVVSSN